MVKHEWLPIVDAFRTFAACPPPVIKAAVQQIQTVATERPLGLILPSPSRQRPISGCAVIRQERNFGLLRKVESYGRTGTRSQTYVVPVWDTLQEPATWAA